LQHFTALRLYDCYCIGERIQKRIWSLNPTAGMAGDIEGWLPLMAHQISGRKLARPSHVPGPEPIAQQIVTAVHSADDNQDFQELGAYRVANFLAIGVKYRPHGICGVGRPSFGRLTGGRSGSTPV
jgi:hypothetical protein